MPAMDSFSSQAGETINLALLVGDEVVVIRPSAGEFYNLHQHYLKVLTFIALVWKNIFK